MTSQVSNSQRQLSLVNWAGDKANHFPTKLLLKTLDRVLGIRRMNQLYQSSGLAGLAPEAFCDKFVETLALNLTGLTTFEQIPQSGPVVIVANHPFGAIEGVVMLQQVLKQRPDVRLFVNRMLGVIEEISPYFIFTNPLSTNAKGNSASLKAALAWLKQGGVLVVFPAGRVSYPQEQGVITDHQWNRMVTSLANKAAAPILPIHIGGLNRPFFYQLGQVYYRFRMMMLVREMLASQGRTIHFSSCGVINTMPEHLPTQQQTDLLNVVTYSQSPNLEYRWQQPDETQYLPLAEQATSSALGAEIANLPEEQKLVSYKQFDVYYGYQSQIPVCVAEIQRLREEEFRRHNEGSGQPKDGDHFDATYTQLFIYDNQQGEIIGAYRMGRTQVLQEKDGLAGLYLSRMFNFTDGFINQQAPCLEMGRSFLIASQQRSFHGLMLLFKGIGRFVSRFPEYRVLYGTVSLSKLYQPASVYLIQRFLIDPKSQGVTAKCTFDFPTFIEAERYLAQYDGDIETLDWLIKQIEPDGKGLPVLVKQYHTLGAKFHCLGLDPNFAQTPGLLLSVDLTKTPEKLLKLYLGKDYQGYLDAAQ